MPITAATIQRFEGGIAPALDPADIEPGTALTALDTDPHGLGRLRGRKGDVVRGLVAAVTEESVAIKVSMAERIELDAPGGGTLSGTVVVDQEAGTVYLIADNGFSQRLASTLEGTVLPGPYRMATGALLFAVEGGDPLYVGPASEQLSLEEATVEAHQGHVVFPKEALLNVRVTRRYEEEDHNFETETVYFWGVSVLYDNIQESPLIPWDKLSSRPRGVGVNTPNYFQLEVEINNAGVLPRRVTHVNLYRAEASHPDNDATTMPSEPDSAYRLVASLPLNGESEDVDGVEVPWDEKTVGSGEWILDFYDRGYTGPQFEASSGFPETLESTAVDAELSVQGGVFHFVVGKAQEDDGNGRFLYRSLPVQPGVIDWTTHYVALDEKPVAMAFFDGMIYAASRERLWAIDAASLALVRSWDGVGAAGPHAMQGGPAGLLIASPDTVWIVGAGGPQRVGLPLETADGGYDTTDYAVVDYDTFYGLYVVAHYDAVLESVVVFFLDVSRGNPRWFRASTILENIRTSAAQPNGHVSLYGDATSGAVNTELQLMASGGRKGWSWTSHRQAYPIETTEFKPYHFRFEVETGSPEIEVSLDGGSYLSLPWTALTDDELLGPPSHRTLDVPRNAYGLRPRTRHITLRMSGTGDDSVSATSLFLRPLPPR